MAFEKLNPKNLGDTKFNRHRVTRTGDYFTVTELTRPAGAGGAIRKLNATQYLYIPDGEIREFKAKAQTRDESTKSLRRTMNRIRDLINCNVRQDNYRNVHWLTLTYADASVTGIEGTRRVAHDFDVFYKRLRRYCAMRGISKPAHITVLEPTAKGRWHLHTLLIYPHKRPFIHNDDMARMWGQGFTKTQKLPHMGMANYLVSYLTDAPLDELTPEDLKCGARQKDIKECIVDGHKKKYVKGARLFYYPSECNIIRHSQDVIYPTTYDVGTCQMNALQEQGELTYESAVRFTDDETGYEMVVTKRVYRRRRCTARAA